MLVAVGMFVIQMKLSTPEICISFQAGRDRRDKLNVLALFLLPLAKHLVSEIGSCSG